MDTLEALQAARDRAHETVAGLKAARRAHKEHLAAEAGVEVGSKITVRPTKLHDGRAFIEQLVLHQPMSWRAGDDKHKPKLHVRYRLARKNGEPYTTARTYPTGEWTKGWAE